jgi:hypothetical protein
MARQYQQFLGWAAVGLSTLAACFWAFWGIIENFHEGWYHSSNWMNLGVMLAQYLLPMILFVVAALVAIRWPRIGSGTHVAAALGVAWFLRGASPTVVYRFIVCPLVFMGISYWVGRPRPRRWAVGVVAGLPLITLLVCSAEPASRVSGRLDDGDHSARRTAENGADLIWAPEGPGWPRAGVTWEEAVRRCRHLTADGTSLAETPQDSWRLPTVEEIVRSLQRHGQNCGGSWDAVRSRASYQQRPDKESPLWDVHSQVIYWWTATELNEQEAYIIVYNGQVWPRPKSAHWGYLGFRAVKDGGKS